jgi:hypothetical protein
MVSSSAALEVDTLIKDVNVLSLIGLEEEMRLMIKMYPKGTPNDAVLQLYLSNPRH